MLLNALVRLRIPTVAVLGNHDYEGGQEAELQRMMAAAGIKVLDGTGYERDGVGFAGTKGFIGGFGRGVLTAFGEREIKAFVQAAIDEAVKLERAMSQLRTNKRIVVLHYSPIASTVMGEAPEIFPFLGTSRLAEVVDRHGADLVLHGHAHRGTLDGKTTAGIPCSRSNGRLVAFAWKCFYRTFPSLPTGLYPLSGTPQRPNLVSAADKQQEEVV